MSANFGPRSANSVRWPWPRGPISTDQIFPSWSATKSRLGTPGATVAVTGDVKPDATVCSRTAKGDCGNAPGIGSANPGVAAVAGAIRVVTSSAAAVVATAKRTRMAPPSRVVSGRVRHPDGYYPDTPALHR